MANTTIKISSLPNIGNNLAGNSLLPVVNTSGTYITDKTTVGAMGNLILSQAGSNFAPAQLALMSQDVINAAQPNITSTGTLSQLTVSGNVDLGYVSDITILGGDNGFFLQTDGSGNLTWAAAGGGGGGNGTPGGANTQIQFNNAGEFGAVSGFTYNTDTNTMSVANANIGSLSTLTNVNTASLSVTSTATLGNLSITGSANLGTVGNVKIAGGSTGQVLTTDGAGTLSWTIPPSSYSNSNVASYLPTYTGNLKGGNLSVSGTSGLGVVNISGITTISNAAPSFNPISGALKVSGGIGAQGNIHANGEIHSIGNMFVGGQSLFVGPDADATGLTNPTLIMFHSGDQYIQAALKNSLSTGSADWVAYGDNGTDLQGWADFGFTSSEFDDPNYTITAPGDGYFIVQTYSGSYGGNLILATGNQGIVNDIIFATGGFHAEDEFARIENADNTLHLTRAGASITFPDGTIQTTAFTGGGGNTGDIGFVANAIYSLGGVIVENADLSHGATSSVVLPANGNTTVPAQINNTYGDVQITTGINSGSLKNWKFDQTGDLTFPGGTFAGDDIEGTGNFGFEMPANVGFGILTDTGNSEWSFSADGALTLPSATGPGSNAGRIQTANSYPTLLAYGSGGHGGPELDWMSSNDPANQFFDNTVLRHTMYLNDEGFYIGFNENDVVGTPSPSLEFTPDGNLTAPGNVQIGSGTGNAGVLFSSNPNGGTGFYANITGITNGSSTVVVTLADVEFTEGDQGTVRIASVQGETEANGFWGWQAVDIDKIQLYTDSTLSTPVDGTTWSAYTSGGVATSSGYNELDIRGGHVSITTGAGQYWSFNPDGNLVLPSNTSAINYANGAPYGGGSSGNTGNVTFSDQIVIGTGDTYGGSGLYLAPGPNSLANAQYLQVRGGDQPSHIHFDTGNNNFYDQYFGNDNKYVKLSAGADGNILIGTDDTTGNLYRWTFDSTGGTTVPGDIKSITTGFSFTSNISDVDTTTVANAVIVTFVTSSLFPGPVTGQVTISGVVGTTETNGTWYFEAVEANQIQLYYDEALQYPVDGAGWPAYVSNGLAVAAGYNNLSITGGNVSIVNNNNDTLTFNNSGNLIIPGVLSVTNTDTVSGTNEAGVPGVQGSQTFNAQLAYSPGIDTIQAGWTVTGNNLVGTTTVTSVVEYSPGFYEITTDTTQDMPFWYNDVYTFTGIGYSSWTFNPAGSITFPTLTVDIHNGGNQTAQTLQFGDNTQQAIITGPTPTGNNNAERLIIQGQRGAGTGEGGDVYFWAGDADTNGGDIKIYAGDADNVSVGYGGYVNIEGGQGFTEGGYVSMTAGQSVNGTGAYAQVIGGGGNTAGGTANLVGGQGSIAGGDAYVKGGYGGGSGGNVNITGGVAGNGLAEYGNVNINAGASSWSFNNTGNLTFPNGSVFAGNVVTTPTSTTGTVNPFVWHFNDNVIGSSTTQLEWNSLDTDQNQWYLSTDSKSKYWLFDSTTKAMGYIGDGGSGALATVTFGNSVNGGTGTVHDIQLTTSTSGNIYNKAGNSTWTFDNTGNLTLPTISTGEGTDEQSIISSQRKVIPPNRYSAAIDGATPTIVYTARPGSLSLKSTIVVQHAGLGLEMFDVYAVGAGADVIYSVSNRLNATGEADTTAVVDWYGSGPFALAITLTVNSGATTSWVTYDSTEFGIPND
jgi:hypothetical protein